MNDFYEYMKEHLEIKDYDIRTFSPLVLAYIGDAIYELIIRSKIVAAGNAPVQTLHKRSSNLVKASTQAAMMRAIEPLLTEEESSVFKRGRNAKSTTPKNASVVEYRAATGFEATMGYLYLKKEYRRMIDLIQVGLEQMKDMENKK